MVALLGSVSLFAAAAVLVVVLGLEPRLVSESSASSRFSHWQELWRRSDATIRLGQDVLPATLPGPADSWAGSKPHSLSIGFDADPGAYVLILLVYDTHESDPPRLSATLNGHPSRTSRLDAAPGSVLPTSWSSLT
jgi:hypothetical protein